jgi:succinate dehydrogenase/fumarate reductase cytochrome b subunit
MHRYAGFFLLVVIAGHVLAVRGASWFYDIYPRFDGLAFSIDAVPGYFYPYYFLLGVTGFYHALNGLGIALTRLGMPLKIPPVLLRNATGIAAFVLTTALLALGGVLFDVGDLSQSAFGILALELVGDFAS